MAHCDNPFAQHRALNSCRAFSLLSSSLGRLIGARPGLTPPVERSSQANFDFGAEGAHLLLGRSREQRAQVRLKPEGETAIFWRLVRYHRKILWLRGALIASDAQYARTPDGRRPTTIQSIYCCTAKYLIKFKNEPKKPLTMSKNAYQRALARPPNQTRHALARCSLRDELHYALARLRQC